MTTAIQSQPDVSASVRAQARLRAAVGLPIISVVLVILIERGSVDGLGGMVAVAHISYILLMLLAARSPRVPPMPLAYATAVLDPILLSAWLPLMGEYGGLVVGFYLFTILGFGFRIGPRLMAVCQVVSIAGFSSLLLSEPFWDQHLVLWLSFIITLLIVPLYATLLLRKLHEARAHAERESQAKSQLLAKVSHELRTPLSGIVAAAQLLSAESADSRVTRRADVIMGLSRDLLREINDLLDQAKYDARALVLDSTLFDLRDLMERVRVTIESTAVKKGLEFNITLDPQITDRIQGDSHYLAKVLLNLAGNAVKFTDQGSVSVSAVLASSDADHYTVRFEVRDTGIGIAPELHSRIFEPFFQADSVTTRRYGGTGLGMTIAREIVLLMGRDIVVQSAPGSGSSFSFELSFPRIKQGARGIAEPAPAPVVTGKRVLVVDDNATNLALVRELLQRDRHEVSVAASGAEALQELSAGDFDVVFLDFNMGDMDGAKVLKIYRMGKLNPAPAYFLTADATEATAIVLRDAGAVDILNKPITQDMLRRAVADVCSQSDPRESAARQRTWVEEPSASKQYPPADASGAQPSLVPVPTQYLDHAVIMELKGLSDRPEFLGEILGNAANDIERNSRDLMQALAVIDTERVRDTAHALKGVCASVGATRLESLMRRLTRVTTEELRQTATRVRADVAEASRESIAAIRDIRPDQVVNG